MCQEIISDLSTFSSQNTKKKPKPVKGLDGVYSLKPLAEV